MTFARIMPRPPQSHMSCRPFHSTSRPGQSHTLSRVSHLSASTFPMLNRPPHHSSHELSVRRFSSRKEKGHNSSNARPGEDQSPNANGKKKLLAAAAIAGAGGLYFHFSNSTSEDSEIKNKEGIIIDSRWNIGIIKAKIKKYFYSGNPPPKDEKKSG